MHTYHINISATHIIYKHNITIMTNARINKIQSTHTHKLKHKYPQQNTHTTIQKQHTQSHYGNIKHNTQQQTQHITH